MNDIMCDLEAMGTRLDGAIVGIGMVEFDLPQGIVGRTFFRAINLGDAVNNHGAKMDAATVSWWLSQSKAAQGAIVTNCYSVRQALLDVTEFMAGNPDVKVWGNGCFFDNAMLSHLYRVVGLPQPWKFWNDRCYRTVCAMHRSVEKDEFVGTRHDAVDDAMAQVKHLMKIRAHVRGGK